MRAPSAMALLLLSGWLAGCGVRGNPRPPLPEPHLPPPPAGAAADAGR
jgi:hypothetical protein